MTNIIVYGKHRLQNYDCSLTSPQLLRGKVAAGDEVQFYYRQGNNPHLKLETVTSGIQPG